MVQRVKNVQGVGILGNLGRLTGRQTGRLYGRLAGKREFLLHQIIL